MKKRGFTLIEMLGILVVLSIIVMISVPTITSMLKKSYQKKYDDWLTSLYVAAETYVEDHREEFYEVNGGGTSYLSIQLLLDQGYLKNSVKEPTTGKDVTKVGVIEVKPDSEKILQYKFILKDTLDSITISVGISPDSSGGTWTSKDVTITIYATPGAGMRADEFSFDGGQSWQKSNKKVVNKNGTWQVMARDSRFDQRSQIAVAKVNHIDKTVPDKATATINLVSTKAITVNAVCEDYQSGIRGYKYSKDNGSTWTEETTAKSYKFDNLTTATYQLKVKCLNKAGLEKASSAVSQKTASIPTPTCTISPTSGWTRSKKVTLNYGDMPSNSTLTYQYQIYSGVGKDGSTTLTNKKWLTSSTKTKEITMSPTSGTSTGSLIVKSTDGVNTQTSSSCTVTEMDIDNPTCTITPNKTTNEPSLVLTINYSDTVGSVASSGYSWTSASSGFSSTKTKTITSNGTYHAWVKDKAGNVGTCSKAISNIKTTFNITYNLNGGTNHASNKSTYNVGTGATLYNPTRTGYTFNGWYTDSALTKKITSISTTQTGNVTLYAKWTINSYTVTFVNGLGTTLKTETVNYGGNATAPANPTRTGYTFNGWSGTYTNVTSNRTITATWKIKSYTLTVTDTNSNGSFTLAYGGTKAISFKSDGYVVISTSPAKRHYFHLEKTTGGTATLSGNTAKIGAGNGSVDGGYWGPNRYYNRSGYSGSSIVDALKANGISSTESYRKKLYEKNFSGTYSKTSTQNSNMLKKFKTSDGLLVP